MRYQSGNFLGRDGSSLINGSPSRYRRIYSLIEPHISMVANPHINAPAIASVISSVTALMNMPNHIIDDKINVTIKIVRHLIVQALSL